MPWIVVVPFFLHVLALGEGCVGEGGAEIDVSLLQLHKSAVQGMDAGSAHVEVREDKKSDTITAPYKGIIIPHVSKVGGTSLHMLAKNIAQLLNVPFTVPNADDDISHLSGVLYMLDNHHYILKDEDKRDFFVMGTYRNPCDAALSLFCYISEMELKDEWVKYSRNYTKFREVFPVGVAPPFDDPQSKENFRKFVFSDEVGYSEEHRMIQKYNATGSIKDAASCWMNLYNLRDDMVKCLTQYVHLQQIEEAPDFTEISHQAETIHANPSHHVRCSDMFDKDMITSVESENQHLLQAFDLTCCSE